MLTIASFAGLLIAAYVFDLLFFPSFRKTEIEDAKRTGCAFHAVAWAIALVVGFGALLILIGAAGAVFPQFAQFLSTPSRP